MYWKVQESKWYKCRQFFFLSFSPSPSLSFSFSLSLSLSLSLLQKENRRKIYDESLMFHSNICIWRKKKEKNMKEQVVERSSNIGEEKNTICKEAGNGRMQLILQFTTVNIECHKYFSVSVSVRSWRERERERERKWRKRNSWDSFRSKVAKSLSCFFHLHFFIQHFSPSLL